MPVEYSREIGDEICRLISEGKSLVNICRRDWMPCRQAVHEWVLDNRDGFGDRYARARELQAEYYAEQTIEISDGVMDSENLTSEQVQAARLAVDTRKWVAAKLDRKKFGDKLEHSSDPKNPIIPDRALVDARIVALLIEGGLDEAAARKALLTLAAPSEDAE